MKKATMQDVADLAGVSQASVSLILNNNEKITFSNETKERVYAAARELDYKLPRRRRHTLRKSSRLILVLVPTLSNQYYVELLRSVEAHAERLGYRVMICNTFRRADLEKFYLDTFLGHQADGVIYTFLPSFPRLIEQLAETAPVVLIGEKHEDLAICSIELSNITAGAMLAEHLFQLGHRQFAFLSTPFNQLTLAREQRLEGLRRQLEGHGLTEACIEVIVDERKTADDPTEDNAPYEYNAGRYLTAAYLSRSRHEATALIGANDMTAIGILNELQFQAYQVPRDFSVCGFDNVFSSRITSPGLTSIDHHLQTRCKSAVETLLSLSSQADNGEQLPFLNKIEYTPQLVIRGSSGPVKKSS